MANIQQSQGEFRDTNPGRSGIKLLYGTGSNAGKVIAATVSTEDCGFTNFAAEFESLESFTVHDTTFTITSRLPKASWFFFRVTPLTFNSSSFATGSTCLDTTFVPSADIDFKNNVYNVTFNSSQTLRTSPYIFTVDNELSGSSAQPQNVRNILDGNAVTASVQDSFYSSRAIITGRYEGSVSSEADYGISPAFTAVARQGAFYSPSTEDTFILGQNESDRNVEEYFLVVQVEPGLTNNSGSAFSVPAGSSVSDLEPNVRIQTLGHQPNLNQTAGTTGTTLFINDVGLRRNLIDFSAPGDILLISQSTTATSTEEVVELLDSGVYTLPKTNPETLVVRRNITSAVDGGSYTALFSGGEKFIVFKLNGDLILRQSNNELFKATEAKLYDIETETIYLTGNNGRIIFNSGSQF